MCSNLSVIFHAKIWPWGVMTLILAAAIVSLHLQGRLWICASGHVYLWTSDTFSSDNSQHLFDPYSFTHVLHGILFCGLLAFTAPWIGLTWRLSLALLAESLWEVVENTEFVIQRYREATAALGYQGDTILNSMGDILTCGLGFLLAHLLGWRLSILLFLLVEVVLLVWIRDSLLLNILMLLYPLDAIKTWQMGQ